MASKRISDKQRLDWLTKGGGTILADDYGMWTAIPQGACSDDGAFTRKQPRAAIDAAILAERPKQSKPSKPKRREGARP